VLPDSTPDAVLSSMRSQGFVQDPNGRWAHRMPDGSLVTGLLTTAHDLARLGLLLVAGGSWSRKRIVSSGWLERATRSSQELNPAYGHLFWVGGQRGNDPFGQPFERFESAAPEDVVAARGANQQLVDVSPSLGIVVVRTATQGARIPTRPPPDVGQHLWSAVMRARR